MADLEKSSSESQTQEPTPRDLDPDSEERAGVEAAETEDEPKNRRGRRAAASQARKQRLRERQEAEAVGLGAQEMLDDALVRSTDSASKWFRNNSGWLQGIVVAGLAIWAGWGIYSWQLAEAKATASAKVANAVAAERGRVGDPPAAADPDFPDPTPQFEDEAARLAAAKNAFEAAAQERSGSGTAMYSKLALAALLLDQKKYDEASAAFEALKSDPFATSDPELRGRALEGIALAAEAKGDKAAAKKAYAALENADILGYVELALYHQARLSHELGETDAAKQLAEKLNAKLAKNDRRPPAASYLVQSAKSLSEELGIEPPADQAPATPGQITAEQLKALQEQMQRAIQNKAPAKSSAPDTEKAPAPETAPNNGGAAGQ